MPNHPQRSFDHEATLEELAGVGKNRRFDEVIDDDESEDLQVICKRGEEEIPLAKPSRAFYFGDRNLYDQEAKRFDQEEKARILNTDQFSRNLARFEELKRSCQRGFVIPFVGAGMHRQRQQKQKCQASSVFPFAHGDALRKPFPRADTCGNNAPAAKRSFRAVPLAAGGAPRLRRRSSGRRDGPTPPDRPRREFSGGHRGAPRGRVRRGAPGALGYARIRGRRTSAPGSRHDLRHPEP